MEGTIYSLIPPFIAITMVILTRRVILSLGLGILSAALLLANGNLADTVVIVWEAFKGIFWEDGSWNTWNIYIEAFVIILGIVTAFISINGGTRAFGEWAMKRIKTRAGAQIMTAVLGIAIFLDDYFNSLAVGQVSRPITDRHRISRAKLAYIIDSTSAPVCVIAPISSWGAYIIGIVASVFAAHGVTQMSAFTAFVQMIPMNLYVWSALALVFIVAIRDLDFGAMKTHEKRARETGQLFDPDKDVPGETKTPLPESEQGSVHSLIWPIVALIIATVVFMIWTGYSEGASIMEIFGDADVSVALFYGGLFGLLLSFIFFIQQSMIKKAVNPGIFLKGTLQGIRSMLPAVLILIFAWAIVDLIGQLKTGAFLAGIVENSSLPIGFLPFLLFIIAGIIAFSTGTSWGAFGILIPIAGEIAAVVDINIILPSMAAVLAGAVFGDHCSPISDTTILSSTGAGSNLMDHVMTQMPYAFIAAAVSALGYLVLGFSGSTLAGLGTIVILLIIIMFLPRKNTSVSLNEKTIE